MQKDETKEYMTKLAKLVDQMVEHIPDDAEYLSNDGKEIFIDQLKLVAEYIDAAIDSLGPIEPWCFPRHCSNCKQCPFSETYDWLKFVRGVLRRLMTALDEVVEIILLNMTEKQEKEVKI